MIEGGRSAFKRCHLVFKEVADRAVKRARRQIGKGTAPPRMTINS